MIVQMYFNEWKWFLRNSLLRTLVMVFGVSLTVVTWFGLSQSESQILAQEEAHHHIRAQWDEMEPSNPHSAAHFGSYAFKPMSVLSSVDEGINGITGNVLRLEGHTQNEMMFSEASQSQILSKFGKLKPSLLFQFLIPLLLLFLSFDAYPREIQSGRLKLLVNQGVSISRLVMAKVSCVWTIGLGLLVITLCTQILFAPAGLEGDQWTRLFVLMTTYSMYYLVLINMTVLMSLWLRSATASISVMIGLWILWTIFVPKIIGNVAEQMVSLPTRIEFQEAMSQDRSEGIDGHNPSDERRNKLEQDTLTKYNVETLEELPINFAGIVMQADEEYGNDVWDKHFGQLYIQLEHQKGIVQYSGLLNPFSSVQSLSMGTAGTDMFHHLDFLRQAEDYRRIFIKTLNDEYAFGGAKTGERGWKADTAFFQSVKDFTYTQPSLGTVLSKYIVDIVVLFMWSVLSILLLTTVSKRSSVL